MESPAKPAKLIPASLLMTGERPASGPFSFCIYVADTLIQSNLQIVSIESKAENQGSEVQSSNSIVVVKGMVCVYKSQCKATPSQLPGTVNSNTDIF